MFGKVRIFGLRTTPMVVVTLSLFLIIILHGWLVPEWWEDHRYPNRALNIGYSMAAYIVLGGITRNIADRRIKKVVEEWLSLEYHKHPNLDDDSIQIVEDVLMRKIGRG